MFFELPSILNLDQFIIKRPTSRIFGSLRWSHVRVLQVRITLRNTKKLALEEWEGTKKALPDSMLLYNTYVFQANPQEAGTKTQSWSRAWAWPFLTVLSALIMCIASSQQPAKKQKVKEKCLCSFDYIVYIFVIHWWNFACIIYGNTKYCDSFKGCVRSNKSLKNSSIFKKNPFNS